MSARAEDAARALSREQPTTADAAVPAPANNGSADAEGVEIPAPEPSGNKNLLAATPPATIFPFFPFFFSCATSPSVARLR